jgi:hypothetical protein
MTRQMHTPAKLRSLEDLLSLFSADARSSVRKRMAPPRSSGGTLRPGPVSSPLWNKLVAQVRPLLKRRGEKAQLARLLGLHRQGINEYFVSGSRMPDAERTLLLLEWIEARRKNERPS